MDGPLQDDDLGDVVRQLRSRRDALQRRLDRIEAALEALGQPDRVARHPSSHQGPSVAERVLRLLDEEDRSWSTNEVIDEYKRRGDPLHGSSVTNNVRSVFASLTTRKKIKRVEPGRYKSLRWDQPALVAGPHAEPPEEVFTS